MSRALRITSLLEELRVFVEEHADAESLAPLENHIRAVHDRALGMGEPLSLCTTAVVMITSETRDAIRLFEDVSVAAERDGDLSRSVRDQKRDLALEALTRFLLSNPQAFDLARRRARVEDELRARRVFGGEVRS